MTLHVSIEISTFSVLGRWPGGFQRARIQRVESLLHLSLGGAAKVAFYCTRYPNPLLYFQG